MKNLNKNEIPWYGVVWKTLLVTAVLFAFSFTTANAQDCQNETRYPTAAKNLATSDTITISTVNYLSEYSEASGIISGYDYKFTAKVNSDDAPAYITVRSGSYDGPLVDSGISPLSITASSDDNLFLHWNVDATCATASTFTTTKGICVTCATIEDCEGVPGGPAQPGTPCDDGEESTFDDIYGEDCECTGTPYDCADLTANIGDACDDGDPATVNDVVTADCECAGIMPPAGSTCEVPITVPSLPYTTTDNTDAYGDDYGSADRPDLAENAVGNPSSSYLNGDDVVYAYTPSEDMGINISVTEHGSWAGVFVFTGCPFESTVGGFTTSSATTDLLVEGLPVQAEVTYYIVISTFATPQSTPYTLNIEEFAFDCPDISANFGDACDDGDASTVNDVISEDCECAGELPAAGSVCASAIPVDCNTEPATYSSTASNGTNTTECSMGDNGLWFSFVGTGGDITVNSSATFDHEMSINSGSCGSLVNIDCDDQSINDEEYTISASVDGEMYYVYIAHYSSTGSTTGDITIDIDCAVVPDCTAPTDLVVEGITETSADFSWTTTATQSDIYLVEAGDPAPDENSTPTESGAIPTWTLGILTSNTDYDVYVRSDCGGDGVSEWAGPESFTTLAPPPDNDSCANATAITLGEGGVIGDNTGATPDGPAMDCAFNGDEVQADVWFSFVTPENGNLTIETFLVQGSDFSDTQMQVLDACGGNVIACDEDGGISLRSKIELACGEYTPSQTYYVQVDGYNGDSGEFKISVTNDDEGCDACEMPSDLAIDNITENSAELSWTTSASQSDIYLVEAGDPAPDENSTPTDTGVTSPIALDNLTANTAYDAYVRSDCGAEGVSDWAELVNFTTLATPPDNDDCSGAIALSCGDSIAGTTVGATVSDLGFPSCAEGTPADVFYMLDVTAGTEYTVSVQGADYDAVLAIYSGECDNLVEISCADNGFSPGVEETITYTPDTDGTIVIRTYDWSSTRGSFTITVSCDAGLECETPTDLSFGQVTFDEDGAHLPVSWTPVGSETQWEVYYENANDASDNGTVIVMTDPNTILDLTAGEGYEVQVRAVCDASNNSEWSDTEDIFITPPFVDCEAPTDLAVTVGGPTFATVTWSGDADDYEIAWGVSPYSPGDAGGSEFTTGGSTSYGIGTEPGTEYDVYVRAICGDDNSDWSTISFTSEEGPECEAPSGTTIDNITENSADITWTPANAGDDHWQVSITTIGQSPDDGMMDDVFDDASYTATGLDADTNYNVYVRTVCSEDDSSEWYGGTPFTTDEGDEPADCENPEVSIYVSDDVGEPIDCVDEGGQYYVYVEVTGGSGNSSYTLSDNTGAELETNLTFTYTAGPYDEGDSVSFTVIGNDNDDCAVETEAVNPEVCETEPCPAPTDITIVEVTTTTVTVSWSPGGDENAWAPAYGYSGWAPDEIDPIDYELGVTDTEYTFTNLEPNTDYDFYIYSECGEGDYSDIVGPVPFTTLDQEPEPCEDPYNDDAATSDVYISSIDISGIGSDLGDPTYDLTYMSNSMSTNGYEVITNPTLTVYPGLDGTYTVSSGPAGNLDQYYYSVWFDFNQDGCFEPNEQIIWSDNDLWNGGIPNGEPGVEDVPIAWELTGVAPGTYQARIRNSMIGYPIADGNGDGEALDFTVVVMTEAEANLVLGVEDQVFTDFTYYPNPVNNQLNLHAGKLIEQVEVYNLLGQKVIQEQPNALESNLTTDRLQSGVYLMNVTIDGNQKTFRIVKK